MQVSSRPLAEGAYHTVLLAGSSGTEAETGPAGHVHGDRMAPCIVVEDSRVSRERLHAPLAGGAVSTVG